jgi:ligand-binding sensor domain-containing protein
LTSDKFDYSKGVKKCIIPKINTSQIQLRNLLIPFDTTINFIRIIMLSKLIIVKLAICSIIFTTHAQQIIKSINYTDQKKIEGAILISNGIWAAGEGGSFYYNFFDSTYQTLTKSNGLSGSPITSVAIDIENKLWFGCSDGYIDIYNSKSNSFKRIVDIYNSGNSLKRINNILVKGDTIVISSDFGISLINSKTYAFYDTYFKFGNLPSNVKVNHSTIITNLFFVATESGIAIQKVGATNLVAPESWNVYNTNQGLPVANIKKIVNYKDSILAIHSYGISLFNQTFWNSFNSFFDGKNIKDAFVKNDSLYVLIDNSIYLYKSGTITNLITSAYQPKKIIDISSNSIYLTTYNGVERLSFPNSSKLFYPNGPAYNIFFNLAINTNGDLWVATGNDFVNLGAFKFDFSFRKWSHYNQTNFPVLGTNAIYNVYPGSNDLVYLASWGNGFQKIFPDNKIVIYNTTNTPLLGIKNASSYLVLTSLKNDSQNNLWILNYESANRKNISVLTADSTWFSFDNFADPSPVPSQYRIMLIDQYDTKWFVSSSVSAPGLFYFNENSSNGKKTFTTLTDDKYGFLNSTNGLNTNNINAIVLDKRGDIWVGTSLGVHVITNTNTIFNSTPQLRITSVFSLRQQTINCIAVDAINQKWVGTNQGLLVVSPDGTSLVAAYDSKNSSIVSDAVKSITIDEKRGIVYVGCDGGLTAFYTPILTPLESFDELLVYPSPFIIDESNYITIDGLVKESEVKIFSISGELINHLLTLGGRIAYWDGRNMNGDKVNSGIYFIAAFDKDGNRITKQKIAVIRK